jgi:flavin reductase (DIM6/NTAB) family NADH-FMN oxidoreductase RutF
MATGRKVNKFEAAGLTPVRSEIVNAPYVDEFPLVLECKLIHTFEIGLHTQFIGEIMDVKADDTILDDAGRPGMVRLDPFLFDPGHGLYCGIGEYIGNAFQLGKTLL